MLLRIVMVFLMVMAGYHIFLTGIGYGFLDGKVQTFLSLLKDAFWLGLFGFSVIWYRSLLKGYIQKFWILWILCSIILMIGGGVSRWYDVGGFSIALGVKYGLQWMMIFLMATRFGWIASHAQIEKFAHQLKCLVLTIIISGGLRQLAKMVFPGWFMDFGYGPFGDFEVGKQPPLYYLTGSDGFPRLSGVFSGPNQYGYFLVAFFPFLAQILGWWKQLSWKYFMSHAFVFQSIVLASTVWTLSRAALIALGVQILWLFRHYVMRYKKIVLGSVVVGIVGLISLSLWKRTSTHAHIMYKIIGLYCVVQQPQGYGLGSSGPAVFHHGGPVNTQYFIGTTADISCTPGRILPENMYIQWMLDMGLIGFVLIIVRLVILSQYIYQFMKQPVSHYLHDAFIGLSVGFAGLLIIGMFLHVFEDSMVNYLFFVSWGVLFGYLYHNQLLGKKLP